MGTEIEAHHCIFVISTFIGHLDTNYVMVLPEGEGLFGWGALSSQVLFKILCNFIHAHFKSWSQEVHKLSGKYIAAASKIFHNIFHDRKAAVYNLL